MLISVSSDMSPSVLERAHIQFPMFDGTNFMIGEQRPINYLNWSLPRKHNVGSCCCYPWMEKLSLGSDITCISLVSQEQVLGTNFRGCGR